MGGGEGLGYTPVRGHDASENDGRRRMRILYVVFESQATPGVLDRSRVSYRQAHLQQKMQKQAWYEGAHARGGSAASPRSVPAAASGETPARLDPATLRQLVNDAPAGNGPVGDEGASREGSRSFTTAPGPPPKPSPPER